MTCIQEAMATEAKVKANLCTFLAANEVNKAMKEAAKAAEREVSAATFPSRKPSFNAGYKGHVVIPGGADTSFMSETASIIRA